MDNFTWQQVAVLGISAFTFICFIGFLSDGIRIVINKK